MPKQPCPFHLNAVYKRSELHDRYGGQRQGGISTPRDHQFLMIFTGTSGKQHGYFDEHREDGVFLYTGEGQYGDMEFVAGNRALRDHQRYGKSIYVFRQKSKGHTQFVGEYVCTGTGWHNGPDTSGATRKVIVFELTPLELIADVGEQTGEDDDDLLDGTLEDLRRKALGSSSPIRSAKTRAAQYRERSRAIKSYVVARSQGFCEGCGKEAPFKTKKGRPYLEPHHIHRLSDGGPDHPESVAAVCANCHRRAHHSIDAEEFNRMLGMRVVDLERRLDNGANACAAAE